MKYFILLLLCLNMTACNRAGVVFRFADTLIVSKADDYLDLDNSQQERLKKSIRKDLDKVKEKTLPEIAKNLREIEVESRNEKIDKEKVLDLKNKSYGDLLNAGQYFKDTAVDISNTLSNSQYAHLEKQVQTDIEKKTKEYKKDAAKHTAKKYLKATEFWIGSVSKNQKEMITDFAKKNPYPWELKEKNRKSLLEKFLNSKDNKTAREELLTAYFTDHTNAQNPEFKVAMNEYTANLENFYIDKFWPSLSEDQKKTLRRNLLKRASDLEEVAQKK